MSVEMHKVGTIVTHPNKPDWGPGMVVHALADRVFVAFRDEPEKKIRGIVTGVVPLSLAQEQSDAILDYLPPIVRHGNDWAFVGGWKIGRPNYLTLWKAIATEFSNLTSSRHSFDAPDNPAGKCMQLYLSAMKGIQGHFEWVLRPADSVLDVALHAESQDREASRTWMEPVARDAVRIAEGIEYPFELGPLDDESAQARFVLPYEYQPGNAQPLALAAAQTMAVLIERTSGLWRETEPTKTHERKARPAHPISLARNS